VQPLEILNWTQSSVRFIIRIRSGGDLTKVHGIFTDLTQTQNLIRKTFVSKGYHEVQWIFDSVENEHYLMGKRQPENTVLLTLAEIEIIDQGTVRSLEVWLDLNSSDMDIPNNAGFEGLGSLFG